MKRQILTKGEKILIGSKEFEIERVVGEGAFNVCYEVFCGKKSGRLKEFYPLEENQLVRGKNKLPVTSDKAAEIRLKEKCNDYISTLELLEDARRENPMLNNFLPTQEIYKGGESVYVWTPNDKHGLNFAKYLQIVRTAPQESPSDALFNIIRAITHLTKCITELHKIGLIHLDIKPSNFLITYALENELNPQNLSLFDLNSVCNLERITPEFNLIATEGFSAPELKRGKISNRCDIFSIGATLFFATIINERNPAGIYRESFFSGINQFVARSELLTEESALFKSLLAAILKKCLAPVPRNRYANCEELITDLDKLGALLTPARMAKTLKRLNKKIVLTEDEEIKSPTIILQNLLYNVPLPLSQKKINVAVIGGGTFAQKFIDLTIQAVQVPYLDDTGKISDREICIKAFSPDCELNREIYLNFRPALKNFVSVNGSLKAENYARLDFLPVARFLENSQTAKSTAEKIISSCGGQIDYVFIALGEDGLNQFVAQIFSQMVNCPVNFVLHDANFAVEKDLPANPIRITEKITPETINPRLEQLALNTHLVWRGTLSLDENSRKEYLSRYNHEASLAFALSIKYKLGALGLSDAAAETFSEKISDEKILSALAYYEHRRWVLEKISEGWKPPLTPAGKLDYAHCLSMLRRYGKPQDSEHFLHHCLVRSKLNPETELDELDKMSLEMHRAVTAKAAEFKATRPLTDLEIIRDIIGDCQEVKIFKFRLNQILAGNVNHSRNFKSYVNEFRHFLEKFQPYVREIALERLENLNRDFIFVAQSNLRVDYKRYDFDLVRKIPFILTYFQPHLALIWSSEIFRSIGSSLLNPKKITFLYYAEKNTRLDAGEIEIVRKYFNARKIGAEINFIVAANDENILHSLKKIFETHNINCAAQICSDYSDAIEFFMATLDECKPDIFDGSTPIFRNQFFQSVFTQKIFEQLPYFEFDSAGKKFNICHKCTWLKFVEEKISLRVDEIFELGNLQILSSDNIFEDYTDTLWEVYAKNRTAFNRLAEILRRYDDNHKNFTFVKIAKNLPSDSCITLKYFLPIYAQDGAENLLKKLAEFGFVESFAISSANDLVDIEISTTRQLESTFNELFGNAADLIDPAFLKIRQDGDSIIFFLSTLKVKSFALPEDAAINEILKQLAKKHFVSNLKIKGRRAGFRYVSTAVKKFLTNTAEILKSRICYELLRSGDFDEVLFNAEFARNDAPAEKLHLDFILIKDFFVMVVGVRQEISVESLLKFNSSANAFGIAAKKIFIAAEENLPTKYLEQARNLNITLISYPADIAETFRKLAQKGAY